MMVALAISDALMLNVRVEEKIIASKLLDVLP